MIAPCKFPNETAALPMTAPFRDLQSWPMNDDDVTGLKHRTRRRWNQGNQPTRNKDIYIYIYGDLMGI